MSIYNNIQVGLKDYFREIIPDMGFSLSNYPWMLDDKPLKSFPDFIEWCKRAGLELTCINDDKLKHYEWTFRLVGLQTFCELVKARIVGKVVRLKKEFESSYETNGGPGAELDTDKFVWDNTPAEMFSVMCTRADLMTDWVKTDLEKATEAVKPIVECAELYQDKSNRYDLMKNWIGLAKYQESLLNLTDHLCEALLAVSTNMHPELQEGCWIHEL